MSAIVVVNQGEEAFLDLILAVNMTLRLYKNDVTAGLNETQIEALTQAAFTEANFAGYAASSITGGTWTTTQGNPSDATNTQRTFTRSSTGTAQLIYGYYVTRNSDGALQWFENFDAPISIEFLNDAIQITPRLTLDDDEGRNLVDLQVFTSSGTWTKPAGLKAVRVRLVGGGGSGGGVAATAAGQAAEAGAGGGGGYSEEMILAGDLGATETVTVGAGGTAAAAGANNGNAGGTTSFGSHLSATAGAGGTGGAASGTSRADAGGAGGTGSGGDVNVAGSAGMSGRVNGGAVTLNTTGGASRLSATAPAPAANSSGAAGQAYGGGSSGANNGASQAARASLAGAAGVVLVEEFF